jgi:hypothetical protein
VLQVSGQCKVSHALQLFQNLLGTDAKQNLLDIDAKQYANQNNKIGN